MPCRACVKLPLDMYRLYARIDTQLIKNPHDLLVQLSDLDYGENPDIGTIKKERGDIFLDCCT